MTSNRVAIAGSERAKLPGGRLVGPANPKERIEVTLLLKPTSSEALPCLERSGHIQSHERTHMPREEFAAKHGADPKDVAKIDAVAHEHGLDAGLLNLVARTANLSGTVQAMSEAFNVTLQVYDHPGAARTAGSSATSRFPAGWKASSKACLVSITVPKPNPTCALFMSKEGLGTIPSEGFLIYQTKWRNSTITPPVWMARGSASRSLNSTAVIRPVT